MPKHRVQTRTNQTKQQTVRSALSFMLLMAAAQSVGCSSSSGESPDAGADPAPVTSGDAGSDQVVGTFNVALIAPSDGDPSGHTSVVGKVYDGPTPGSIIWETAASVGACKLSKPHVPFCAEVCGGSAVCVDDDTCQPYPTAHNVGTVRVSGVKTAAGATEFAMEAIAKTYQPTADIKLTFPGFAEGDQIKLSAAGGDYSPFALSASGVAPLELAEGDLGLVRGNALHLGWTAAGRADVSSIHVKLDISHHGGTKGMIECDADDTGTLEIASALIDALLDLGVAGYPTIIVTRHSDAVTGIAPGNVKLSVYSQAEREVQVPGLTSCAADEDCPSGKTCQSDLSCK